MKRLPWKYCECGCKGSTLQVSGVHLWAYNDLHGKESLYRGHSFYGVFIGEYRSTAGLNRAVRRVLKAELKERLQQVEELEALL